MYRIFSQVCFFFGMLGLVVSVDMGMPSMVQAEKAVAPIPGCSFCLALTPVPLRPGLVLELVQVGSVRRDVPVTKMAGEGVSANKAITIESGLTCPAWRDAKRLSIFCNGHRHDF
jgi:hypothetical protein